MHTFDCKLILIIVKQSAVSCISAKTIASDLRQWGLAKESKMRLSFKWQMFTVQLWESDVHGTWVWFEMNTAAQFSKINRTQSNLFFATDFLLLLSSYQHFRSGQFCASEPLTNSGSAPDRSGWHWHSCAALKPKRIACNCDRSVSSIPGNE